MDFLLLYMNTAALPSFVRAGYKSAKSLRGLG